MMEGQIETLGQEIEAIEIDDENLKILKKIKAKEEEIGMIEKKVGNHNKFGAFLKLPEVFAKINAKASDKYILKSSSPFVRNHVLDKNAPV